MSGIAGILYLQGQVAERGLLEDIARELAYSGPDRQAVWHDGPAGLVHALQASRPGAQLSPYPASLDGCCWMTGDVRLDARDELIHRLLSAGERLDPGAEDGVLILHAWRVYGKQLVEHLLGDFAFAIWDSRDRSLFCARDHFGVRPFYYTVAGQRIAFSNSLDCLLGIPDISAGLNERAAMDFLVFGHNQDTSSTIHAAIRQIPPAHTLTIGCDSPRPFLRRYWELPVEETIRYRNGQEYVDNCRELLARAVRDRLPEARFSIAMSGGLDSTSLAVLARAQSAESSPAFELGLYTTVAGALWSDDREAEYAELVARSLGTSIRPQPADSWELFQPLAPEHHPPAEPECQPFLARIRAQSLEMAEFGPVVLTGDGGDSVLSSSPAYLSNQLGSGRWRQSLVDLCRTLALGRRPPLMIRTGLKRRYECAPPMPKPPPWIRPEAAARTQLADRWEVWLAGMTSDEAADHPSRPGAFAELSAPLWPHTFARRDPGATGIPLEVRYPFFDQRLVRFLLRVPALPWFQGKHLLRSAMEGLLPDAVRLRPKTIPAVDPVYRALTSGRGRYWRPLVDRAELLSDLVDGNIFKKIASSPGRLRPTEAWLLTRPLSLIQWLDQKRGSLRMRPTVRDLHGK